MDLKGKKELLLMVIQNVKNEEIINALYIKAIACMSIQNKKGS